MYTYFCYVIFIRFVCVYNDYSWRGWTKASHMIVVVVGACV